MSSSDQTSLDITKILAFNLGRDAATWEVYEGLKCHRKELGNKVALYASYTILLCMQGGAVGHTDLLCTMWPQKLSRVLGNNQRA